MVLSVGCAKPPYGEQAQPTLNNVVQKPLGRLAQGPLSPHKPPKGGLISATLLVAWRLFWRPPMAENDSPLTPIYNTQVKGIQSRWQVCHLPLTWVLRGLCAPGLGQFPCHFPCGSLVGACVRVWACFPRFGPRRPLLGGH